MYVNFKSSTFNMTHIYLSLLTYFFHSSNTVGYVQLQINRYIQVDQFIDNEIFRIGNFLYTVFNMRTMHNLVSLLHTQ